MGRWRYPPAVSTSKEKEPMTTKDTRRGDRHVTPRTNNRHKPGYVRPPRPGRIKESKFYNAPFISWDGEGANILDLYKPHVFNHTYVLLMNSEGDIATDVKGLSTVACFRHLLGASAKSPGAIHVIFGGSYDANMMFKDIPIELLRKLHKGERIIWKVSIKEVYSIEYRARRELFIGLFQPRRFTLVTHKNGSTHYRANYVTTIRLWDTFGFFQGPFLAALDKYFTQEEKEALGYERIKEGKARRSDFSTTELHDFIIPYTTLECGALVALMQRLREHMTEASISVSRWDGAGAVASAMLRKFKIKEHYEELPPAVMEAARRAYSGGRIEAMQYGAIGAAVDELDMIWEKPGECELDHDDLCSAYPAAMPELCSMTGGVWKLYSSNNLPMEYISPYAIVDISWSFPHSAWLPFYPFFVRYMDGSIYYPFRGRNWIYYPEYKAAIDTIPGIWNHIRVNNMWIFEPGNDVKPFAMVKELYDLRRKWKHEGRGAEKVLKLAYNSFYGKTAQHLGYVEGGHIPPFFNLFYAGMITSITRAKLFRAGMQAPDSIIAFSTDGLWSRKRLQLERGDALGQWEHNTLNGLLLAQSGVYWSYHPNGSISHYSRGMDKQALTSALIMDAWRKGQRSVTIPTSRFVTLGSALASEERFYSKWRSWDSTPRNLNIYATGKRVDIADTSNPQEWRPYAGLMRTRAAMAPMLTSPHDLEHSKHGYPMSWPIDVPWLASPAIADIRAAQALDEQIDIEIQESEF